MTAFRTLSTGPILPNLIRTPVESRAARWNRTAPIPGQRRSPALLTLKRHEHPGLAWQSRPPSPTRVRHVTRDAAIRACFLGANLVLAGACVLRSTGLLRPADAARAFRWSSRLTTAAVWLWRQGRSRPRP